MKLLSSTIITRVWRIWTLLHGILESYIEARRLFPSDKVSLIWLTVQHSPSPYPPPYPPPCGYMMQCYFGKCPLLLSWYNFKNSCKYKNATTTITNSHINTAFESESVHGFNLNSISCTVVHKQPNPPLPQNGCSWPNLA